MRTMLESLPPSVLELRVHVRVYEVAVLDSLEAVLLQPFGVLCVQQSPGNSAGPEVDIGAPAPLVRDGLLDRHVRDLQTAPGDKDAIVAVCGKCDAALAPSNKLIRAEADQAKGLPHDLPKPDRDRARAAPRRRTARCHELTGGAAHRRGPWRVVLGGQARPRYSIAKR
jgi:hypothetical protein